MNIRAILSAPMLLIAASCRFSPSQPVADVAPTTTTADAGAAPACTTTNGDSVVDGLLSQLTPVLDKAWPSVAVSTGLDPYQNVLVNQKVTLKCSYGGDELCAAQAAECKQEYAVVTVSNLTGLAYMQFKNLAVTSLQAQPGNVACPSDTSAKGGPYACSYSGQGSASAFLQDNQPLTASLSQLEVKVECSIPYVKTWTETVFSGSAKCTGYSPQGTGDFNFCAGSCSSGSVANVSYTGLSKLNLKLGSLSCDVSPWYNPASGVAEALASALEKDIVGAIESPLMSALNGFVAGYMPFPSSCGG